MKNGLKMLSLLLACSLLFTGCGSAIDTPATGSQKGTSDVTKLSADNGVLAKLPDTGSDAAKTGAENFSLSLLQTLLDDDAGNTVISPLSAYLALAMAARGASGETLSQMEAMLGATADEIAAFANSETNSLTDTQGTAVLTLSNSVWANDTFRISDEYVKDLLSWFAAESYSCVLSSDEARAAINKWVSTNTQGLIPTLLDENLSVDTALALINTLYMKAKWQTPFTAEATQERDFTTDEQATVQAPMMQNTAFYPYCELPNGGRAVMLHYADCELAFVAILPPQGMTGAQYAKTLTAADWESCRTAEESRLVLTLPKFETETSVVLNDSLQALGMVNAFGNADFSAMSADGTDLFISTVLQKVKIIVDEDGTEAAAATALIMEKTAVMQQNPTELTFDRSFAYAIVDTQSGMPLFLGVEANPAE